MARGEASIDRLHQAIQALGRDDAVELLAEAREAARDRVRSLLTDTLTQAMLDHALEELRPGRRPAIHQPEPGAEPAEPAAAQPEPAAAQPEPAAAQPEPAAEQPEPAPDRQPSNLADGIGDRNTKPGPGVEVAWYVYGVVGAQASPPTTELADAGGPESIETMSEGQLTAVVSRVPADEFAETRLRTNLNDMGWVETMARDHERVLDALCRRATVVPMRMCTVYKTEGGVREMLLRESETLTAALEHLDGKSEWGVKVFFERPKRSGRGPDELASSEESSGAAYMDHRRRERDRTREIDEQVEAAVAEIHEELDSLSEEGTLNPPQRREVSAHRGEMVLNGAYLVDRVSESPFHQGVRALQARFGGMGLELVVTGPWPAYNFLPGRIGAAW